MIKIDGISNQSKIPTGFSGKRESLTSVPMKNSDRVELTPKENKKNKTIKRILGSLAVIGAGVGLYFLCRKKPPKTVEIEPPKPPIELPKPKPHWQEYNELKAEEDRFYNQFISMSPEEDRSLVQEKMNKAAKALSDFKERAKAEDFSLLEKKDLSGATEEERWNYFKNYAFDLMINNEATAFDGMEMFEKYGMRKHIKAAENNPLPHTTLENLMTSLPKKPSDKLTSKMLDVLDKYAVPNNPNDELEVYTFIYVLRNMDYYNLSEHITEDTLLKAIRIMKKMEFWNTRYDYVPNELKLRYIDRTFKDSPRLQEIKDAVNELKKLWNTHNPQGEIK